MLATRRRPVDGYLLLQSTAREGKKKKKDEVGTFKKLFFMLDRDAGLLLYFSSQADAGGVTKGSISLVDVEFVTELAREKPAPSLLGEKKDKEDRSGWQWPFVIHTSSQGTHLFLAPTSEVRDTWTINLEEAVAEAKLRERKMKAKSQRVAVEEARERSDSEVQADFLDILVFDSYVNELRKKEKAPPNESTTRHAQYMQESPLSPLNLAPTKTTTLSRSAESTSLEKRLSSSDKGADITREPWSPRELTHPKPLEKGNPSVDSAGKEKSNTLGSESGQGSQIDSKVRSQTVWRKEELRKPTTGGTTTIAELLGARRIGARERFNTSIAPNSDPQPASATLGHQKMPKSVSTEVYAQEASTAKSGMRKSTSEESIVSRAMSGNVSDQLPSDSKTEKTTVTERSKPATTENIPKIVTPVTSPSKRLYQTLRGRRRGLDESDENIGLSLHRRGPSVDVKPFVQSSEPVPPSPESAKPSYNVKHIEAMQEGKADLEERKQEEESEEESEDSDVPDEPIQLRDHIVLQQSIGAVHAAVQRAEENADAAEDVFSDEFFSQIHSMQRRLSVIYQRLNTLESDTVQPQDGTGPLEEKPKEEDKGEEVDDSARKRPKYKKPSAVHAMLGVDEQQSLREDQEMLRAVVRREVLCRQMHRLVDNPVDHDVLFFVASDKQRVIYGHRAIIRSRSSFFDKLFNQASSSRMDPKGPFIIPETSRETLLEILDFLYSGNLKLSIDNVQSLYKTAAMLHIREMKVACRQFASRYAVPLPVRPTSTPYHLAQRQSVLDLFKHINFQEASLAALSNPNPSNKPAKLKLQDSSSDVNESAADESPADAKGTKSKRLSQGIARVKNAIMSPRNSMGPMDPASSPPPFPVSPTSPSSLRSDEGGEQSSSPQPSSSSSRKERNSNNQGKATADDREREQESSGEREKQRLSGGLRGSFFSRSMMVKTRRKDNSIE